MCADMAQKRPFLDGNSEKDAPNEKRQRVTLQSVVLEAVKANAMQKLLVALEPMLRRVIREEVEHAISKYLPSKIRLPSSQPPNSECKSLRLQFQTRLSLPLYTGSKVEGEHGSAIQVVLLDAATGEVITTGDEASAKLDIVVLEGDFSYDDEDDWTSEEFQNYEVKEREGKRPLLTGDLSVVLREGVGTLGELFFTDNSSWIRSRKFRLGVKLSTECRNGSCVREAKTEAFFVKDHRGQLYKKHYPPALSDDVWRLEKIGKDGAYHKRLSENQINTVEDFLVMYSTGPSKLREIFGNTMSVKTWDSIVEHAKTCVLNETQHVYYPDDSHTIGVILNTIYQPLGIVRNGSYVPLSSLSETEQVYMDRLVQEAYNDLTNLCKYVAGVGQQQPEVGSGSMVSNSSQALQVANRNMVTSQDGTLGNIFMAGGYVHPTYTATSQMQPMQPQEEFIQRNETSQIHMLQQQERFPQRFSQGLTRHLLEGTAPSILDGFNPSTIHPDAITSAVSLGIQQSLLNNPAAWEMLMGSGQDRLFNQHISEPSDEYQGRLYSLWGSDEMLTASNLPGGIFPSSAIPSDVRYPAPSLPIFQSHDDFGGRLRRKAFKGWIKLKAILRCSYFIKKKMALRRRIRIQELG